MTRRSAPEPAAQPPREATPTDRHHPGAAPGARQRIALTYAEVAPDPQAVLRSQGVPRKADPGPRIRTLLDEAQAQLEALAAPEGVLQEVSATDFAQIYPGEGLNAAASPLASIYPQAEALALFAVTLGAGVCERITQLFGAREFALASLLDAAASEAADLAAAALEERAQVFFQTSGKMPPDSVAMRYSPGYCGWHVSGQKKLFARLQPQEIGVTLRPSCLMEPLKSVSGVIVGGPLQIHDFEANFLFCDDCVERGCRGRVQNARSRLNR